MHCAPDTYRVRKKTLTRDIRDTSWYHPFARNHRRPLPAFTGQIEEIKKYRYRMRLRMRMRT